MQLRINRLCLIEAMEKAHEVICSQKSGSYCQHTQAIARLKLDNSTGIDFSCEDAIRYFGFDATALEGLVDNQHTSVA